MMITADTHVHTIASTHAYSTLAENCVYAKKMGLDCIAVTDHGPRICDAPHDWHFGNLRNIPRVIEDIMVLRGMEANILNTDGETDLVKYASLDIVIASFHEPTFPSSSCDAHTQALLNIVRNPRIDIIGHPENEVYKFDYEAVVREMPHTGTVMEFNNHSFRARKGAYENYTTLAHLCKKYKVQIAVSSDAHICYDIGSYEDIERVLRETDFPCELIVNQNTRRLTDWLSQRRSRDVTGD